jgi:hypothetical protein
MSADDPHRIGGVCDGSKALIAAVLTTAVEDVRLMTKARYWSAGNDRQMLNQRVRDFQSARDFFKDRRVGAPCTWMCVYVGIDDDVMREKIAPEIELAEMLGTQAGVLPT